MCHAQDLTALCDCPELIRDLLRGAAADARIAVVVGPEGGLAEEEVRCFLGCNARARLVTLGPSILRTETAGIVAPALVLYELGGMGNRPSPTYEGNRG